MHHHLPERRARAEPAEEPAEPSPENTGAADRLVVARRSRQGRRCSRPAALCEHGQRASSIRLVAERSAVDYSYTIRIGAMAPADRF